jgi:hypothetical protein
MKQSLTNFRKTLENGINLSPQFWQNGKKKMNKQYFKYVRLDYFSYDPKRTKHHARDGSHLSG